MAPRNDQQRRAVILQAAWDCFLQYGYSKTSLSDVARRAGLARPLIYQCFAGKEELFAFVIGVRMDKNFQEAREALALDLPPRAKLMRVLDAWVLEPLQQLAGSPQGEELFEQAVNVTPEVQAAHNEYTRELLMPLIADETAVEVFRLAMRGLLTDHPSIETVRTRVAVLAERFVI